MKHIIIEANSFPSRAGMKNFLQRLGKEMSQEVICHDPYTVKLVPNDVDMKIKTKKGNKQGNFREETKKNSKISNKLYKFYLKSALSKYVRDMKNVKVTIE